MWQSYYSACALILIIIRCRVFVVVVYGHGFGSFAGANGHCLLYRKSNKELPKKEPNVDDPCVCLFIIISFRDRAVTFAIELVAIEVPTTCCCWLGCYRISKNGNSMFGVLFLVSCAVYLK